MSTLREVDLINYIQDYKNVYKYFIVARNKVFLVGNTYSMSKYDVFVAESNK